jgi:hypothetical protein
MIYDLLIYTCRPGTVPAQLKLYAEHGYAVQTRHLGKPVLYGVTETGPINTYVHAWAYESAGERAQKRAAMQADPDWQAFLAKTREAGYLVAQENRILTAAEFGK